MMDYAPPFFSYGKETKQTVRLTFAVWQFRFKTEVVVRGSKRGLKVFERAVSDLYIELLTLAEELGVEVSILLIDEDENELISTEEKGRGEAWLMDMLIAAEIVSVESA